MLSATISELRGYLHMFFGDFFWYLLWIFYFAVYIFIVFLIISDLFRDHKLNGWLKARLDHLPGLRAVPDCSRLCDRAQARAWPSAPGPRGAVACPRRTTTGRPRRPLPRQDIAQAKALLDAGTISQGEFDALKSKALGNQYFGA